MRQTLTLTNRTHVAILAHPLRHGLPWPQGAVPATARFTAHDDTGRALPLAARALNTWPDGSLQWTLIDTVVDLGPSATVRVTVCVATDDAPHSTALALAAPTPSVGPADSLLAAWEHGDLDVEITDLDGVIYRAAADPERRATVEEASPLCTVLRIEGKHTAPDGRRWLDYRLRLTVTAGRDDVRLSYRYCNREDDEPGIELRDMAIVLRTALPADATRVIVQVNRGRHFRTAPLRLQEDLTLCAAHHMDLEHYADREPGGNGRVFIRDQSLLSEDPLEKPWFLRQVEDFKFGTGDHPEAYTWSLLGLVSDTRSLVIAGPNMVGLHPKSLSICGSTARYAVWPDWAGPMAITQGEGRTVELHLAPLDGQADDMAIISRYLSWELGGLYAHLAASPSVMVALDPAHVRECAVFQVHRLPAFEPLAHLGFERKVEAVWLPDEPPPANGHRHYGDVFYGWGIGGNNEEMHGHMWFQEYLRTGRPICLERGLAQARHMADVDICAHSADPYQRGGMCAHGPRHNHCAAYPSHMWFTELLFAYALTGDHEYRDTAGLVCDNLVQWINDDEGFKTICADGRESGQPLINLAWTHAFLPEPRYRAAMERIVRESFMARVARHGRLVYMKPHAELPLLSAPGYGEWAAWEGLFCAWEVSRDDELRTFLLAQLDERLQESRMGSAGSFRATDYNMAAYAYFLTEDPSWLRRVARPFALMFRSGQWPFGYIKSMYYIHLAFEHGLIHDDEIRLS